MKVIKSKGETSRLLSMSVSVVLIISHEKSTPDAGE